MNGTQPIPTFLSESRLESGTDPLSQLRGNSGIMDPLTGGAKDQLAHGTADLSGNAVRGAVEQMRNDGREEWLANYDKGLSKSVSDRSTETSESVPETGGTEGGGTWDSVKNWFSGVFGTAVGNPAAKGVVGNGAGAVSGTAFGILTSNNTVEDKTNEANGIIGLARQGKKGTASQEAAHQLGKVTYDKPDPNADVAVNPIAKKGVEQATAWRQSPVSAASHQEMTGRPAEPGSMPMVRNPKARLEKFESVQNPNPSQDWAINYGDTVRGNSPVTTPDQPKYVPPRKDPVKPDMEGHSPPARQ
jgi:hypothetical protein